MSVVLRPGDQAPELELQNLLSDPDCATARRWGAWGPKTVNGQATAGPLRSTFSVDAQGVLQAARYQVDAYENRFGRVFLIRAAGRSAEEILAALESRLTNDEETERAIVADQLRQIALPRLAGAMAP